MTRMSFPCVQNTIQTQLVTHLWAELYDVNVAPIREKYISQLVTLLWGEVNDINVARTCAKCNTSTIVDPPMG